MRLTGAGLLGTPRSALPPCFKLSSASKRLFRCMLNSRRRSYSDSLRPLGNVVGISGYGLPLLEDGEAPSNSLLTGSSSAPDGFVSAADAEAFLADGDGAGESVERALGGTLAMRGGARLLARDSTGMDDMRACSLGAVHGELASCHRNRITYEIYPAGSP